jgi:hypothetical protein
MPCSALLVPIHVDALLLKEELAMVIPTANFSRLPHVLGGRDINAAIPWLGEAIVSQPFEDQQHPRNLSQRQFLKPTQKDMHRRAPPPRQNARVRGIAADQQAGGRSGGGCEEFWL